MYQAGDRAYLNHAVGGALDSLVPVTVVDTVIIQSIFSYVVRMDDGRRVYARSDWLVERDCVIEEWF